VISFRQKFIPHDISVPESEAGCLAIGGDDDCEWALGVHHTTATTKTISKSQQNHVTDSSTEAEGNLKIKNWSNSQLKTQPVKAQLLASPDDNVLS